MLQINNIKKYYKKEKAVDGISFHINQGEIFGLIGANGAGKSTTMSLIATILKPDSGDILYNGKSIVKSPKHIRSELGYVPQDIALYPALSGKDNLMFWAKTYRLPGTILTKRIREVSEIIGFTDGMLKQKVSSYSGGMKRRLNIGAALLNNPKFVIMDEPTVGIDIIARNQILESVQVLRDKGVTILYCGHYMEEVEKISDTICILENGKLLVCDKKENLLKTNEDTNTLEKLYYKLIGSKANSGK